jgi:hypothetical protein
MLKIAFAPSLNRLRSREPSVSAFAMYLFVETFALSVCSHLNIGSISCQGILIYNLKTCSLLVCAHFSLASVDNYYVLSELNLGISRELPGCVPH